MNRIKWWFIVGYWYSVYGRFQAERMAAQTMIKPDFEVSDFSDLWWAGHWWFK